MSGMFRNVLFLGQKSVSVFFTALSGGWSLRGAAQEEDWEGAGLTGIGTTHGITRVLGSGQVIVMFQLIK